MIELSVDRNEATELVGPEIHDHLAAQAGALEQEALVRFLAGRDGRPQRGAFASLAPRSDRRRE